MQSITIAGGIDVAIGALAVEVRYRFVGLLRVRLLTTIAVIAALVAWPPTLWVVVGLLFTWVLVRRSRRLLRRRHPT